MLRNTSVEEYFSDDNDTGTGSYYYLNSFENIIVSGGKCLFPDSEIVTPSYLPLSKIIVFYCKAGSKVRAWFNATDHRQLRSSDIATFVVPRTNTRLGDRAFQVAGPRLWNSLPSNLRYSLTLPFVVLAGIKDVFVWLIETSAPSDFCF